MSVRYHHGGRFSQVFRDGRIILDYSLPGDENETFKIHLKRAIMRDEWYNADECEVYMCVRAQQHYGTPWCFTEGCSWCGNHWDRWP